MPATIERTPHNTPTQTCECGSPVTDQPFHVKADGKPVCILCADFHQVGPEYRVMMGFNHLSSANQFEFQTRFRHAKEQRAQLLADQERRRLGRRSDAVMPPVI